MAVEDIVKAEAENHKTLILFREGIFWKAYEKSAYTFCKHIKPFQVKKKYIKSVNDEIVSIGFPMSSTQTILQERKVLLEEERKMIVEMEEEITHDDFIAWKNAQPLTDIAPLPISGGGGIYNRVAAASPATPANYSNQEKDIITRIKQFSLESKTPLDCMLFLAEIKKQLS